MILLVLILIAHLGACSLAVDSDMRFSHKIKLGPAASATATPVGRIE